MRKGEVTKAAARVVRAACEAAQWASLTRGRETAAQLEGFGLHLPELLGGANAETAACAACGVEARRLYCVQDRTPAGKVALVDERICAAAAQRVCTCRGRHTQEAVRKLHAEKGVHVCVACAAQRRVEARMEAKGAAERKAATEALQAAWAAAEQVRPGVGAETTGAVQVRRAEERCKEAERATKLGDAEVADALWQARCALVEAPLDLARAFPGVQCTAAQGKCRVNAASTRCGRAQTAGCSAVSSQTTAARHMVCGGAGDGRGGVSSGHLRI